MYKDWEEIPSTFLRFKIMTKIMLSKGYKTTLSEKETVIIQFIRSLTSTTMCSVEESPERVVPESNYTLTCSKLSKNNISHSNNNVLQKSLKLGRRRWYKISTY